MRCLQATVHSSLGKWLSLQKSKRRVGGPAEELVAAADDGLLGYPALLLWFSKFVSSSGSYIIVLQVLKPPTNTQQVA